jgi:hypothetical protein
MSLPTLRQVARDTTPTPTLLTLALRMLASLPLAFSLVMPAAAQYTGHTANDKQKKAAVEPRAISVLEWIGTPGKPVASRIVPVAVYVNGQYQDGGLYLAQPEPLTVQTDTLYELEKAGVPQGNFYVAGGQDVGGAWFGYGQWKPLSAPKPVKKLPQSKVPPTVVQDHDPDRPHFKGGGPQSSGSTSTGSNTSSSGSSTASTSSPASSAPASPATDPDKPILHRRTDSTDSSSGTTSSSSGTTASSGSGSSGAASPTSNAGTTNSDDPDKPTLHRRDSTVSDTGAGTAPDDPDRPHLKKHSETAAGSGSGDDGSPVSSVNEADPDRPRMSRGVPAQAEKALDMSKLSALPADLQQMAAISDPAVREEHVFTYSWPDPDEATKMQAAVEALAVKVVLANVAPAPAAMTTPAPAKRTTGPKSTLARQVPPKALPVVLQDKDFRAFELTYSGGATLVFTAKALVGPNNAGVTLEKYVTLIAQPDFDGDPQIRLQSVTDAKHLDITPRMRLVDAVDTRGDNQADLLFELRRSTDRQFAIYHMRGSHAEQAFATESLPIGAPNHSAGTDSN